jgi:hypothetical protein
MVKRFKIEHLHKEGYYYPSKYVIKRKFFLMFPFYIYIEMTRDEFFGDIRDGKTSNGIAIFNNTEHALDALHQYSQINGIEEVIVKIHK